MGLFGVAIVGSAGLFAYKKIKKSRKDKRNAQQQQETDFYRDLAYDSNSNVAKPSRKFMDSFSRDSKSKSYADGDRYSSSYYHQNNDNYNSNNTQNYPPPYRTLTFQPASENFRGQHISVDQMNNSYYQSQSQPQQQQQKQRQQRFSLDANHFPFRAAAPRGPVYRHSGPGPRYQSGFVEELDENESVRA